MDYILYEQNGNVATITINLPSLPLHKSHLSVD